MVEPDESKRITIEDIINQLSFKMNSIRLNALCISGFQIQNIQSSINQLDQQIQVLSQKLEFSEFQSRMLELNPLFESFRKKVSELKQPFIDASSQDKKVEILDNIFAQKSLIDSIISIVQSQLHQSKTSNQDFSENFDHFTKLIKLTFIYQILTDTTIIKDIHIRRDKRPETLDKKILKKCTSAVINLKLANFPRAENYLDVVENEIEQLLSQSGKSIIIDKDKTCEQNQQIERFNLSLVIVKFLKVQIIRYGQKLGQDSNMIKSLQEIFRSFENFELKSCNFLLGDLYLSGAQAYHLINLLPQAKVYANKALENYNKSSSYPEHVRVALIPILRILEKFRQSTPDQMKYAKHIIYLSNEQKRIISADHMILKLSDFEDKTNVMDIQNSSIESSADWCRQQAYAAWAAADSQKTTAFFEKFIDLRSKPPINEGKLAMAQLEAGEWYLARGQLLIAKSYFETSIATTKEIFGENHINFANCLAKLSHWNFRLGNFKEAEQKIRKAIEIEKKLDEPSSFFLQCLAAIHLVQGKLEEAFRTLIMVCSNNNIAMIEMKIFTKIAQILLNNKFDYNWGRTYLKEKGLLSFLVIEDRLALTRFCFDKCYELIEDVDNPKRKKRINELAMNHVHGCFDAINQDYQSAKKKILEVYQKYSELFAVDKPHRLIAEPAANLGLISIKEKEWDAAVRYLTESLTFYYQKHPDPMHPYTDLILKELIEMLSDMSVDEKDINLSGLMEIFGLDHKSSKMCLVERLRLIQKNRPQEKRYALMDLGFVLAFLF